MTMITVYPPGHYDPYDSYGLIACELVRGLAEAGIDVNARGRGICVMDSQPVVVRDVTAKPLRAATGGGIVMGFPPIGVRPKILDEGGPWVGLTMFESTRVPPTWRDPLNQYAAVIVPSRFCIDILRDAGVTVPIRVVPLGVRESYHPQPLRCQGETLTVLAFLDRGRRKGGMLALQAFQRAFGDDPRYQLILKSRAVRVGFEITNPNITVIQRDMTDGELCDLYGRCDVLLNPNLGEGFGLIPREFAATGGIALATGWGGTADYIDFWGVPLPYQLVQSDWRGVPNMEGLDLGQWALPDMDAMVSILRDVVQNRQTYALRAWANALAVGAMYRWADFAARVYEIWQEVSIGDSYRLQSAA